MLEVARTTQAPEIVSRVRTMRQTSAFAIDLPAEAVEKDFYEAGFRIAGKLDFLPLHSMWRVYVLNKR